VKICNQAAADILGVSLQEVIGKPVSGFLEDSDLLGILRNGKAELDQICRLGGEYLVTNCLPIVIDGMTQGVVSTFKEATRIHNIDRKLKEKLYHDGFVATYTVQQIDSRSSQMKKVIEKAKKYAETDLSVLLQGETGTGKEILGHTVHNLSNRKDRPFVAINCSALTESLLESELFGYEEGAFTGAKKGGKIGLFEIANQGSIFLDEIADMSPNIQVKLLRVIEEKKVRRLGGDRLIPVDVRIISSTWKDLREEMEQGRFRMDLFFRVANLKIRIPPLRERVEDIPCLLKRLLLKYGKNKKAISPDMYAAMESYRWPGNVRELNSVVESYLILLGDRESDETLFRDLFEDLRGRGRKPETPAATDGARELPPQAPEKSLHEQLEDFERSVINETLSRFQFNRKATARHLGISMNTLWRKMNPA
jgi:propionate catabolism operon transcriptional regulator